MRFFTFLVATCLLCRAVADSPPPAELRGKLVCLAEEMNRVYAVELPTQHQHITGFKTSDGRVYTLLRTKFSEALFTDPQLASRELLLKAKVFPSSQVLEVTNIKSIKNGVVHDLYYFCDICVIQTIAPGICECCQQPVHLVEKPVR